VLLLNDYPRSYRLHDNVFQAIEAAIHSGPPRRWLNIFRFLRTCARPAPSEVNRNAVR
jgi:hypothetical protein